MKYFLDYPISLVYNIFKNNKKAQIHHLTFLFFVLAENEYNCKSLVCNNFTLRKWLQLKLIACPESLDYPISLVYSRIMNKVKIQNFSLQFLYLQKMSTIEINPFLLVLDYPGLHRVYKKVKKQCLCWLFLC